MCQSFIFIKLLQPYFICIYFSISAIFAWNFYDELLNIFYNLINRNSKSNSSREPNTYNVIKNRKFHFQVIRKWLCFNNRNKHLSFVFKIIKLTNRFHWYENSHEKPHFISKKVYYFEKRVSTIIFIREECFLTFQDLESFIKKRKMRFYIFLYASLSLFFFNLKKIVDMWLY